MNASMQDNDRSGYMGFANLGQDGGGAARAAEDQAARAWAQLKNMAA
ncbi:MAG: hypothetical protein HGA75_03655 [Thiobacillus sp.]|nr:hypothetical protein [Thiobacillus sp.]